MNTTDARNDNSARHLLRAELDDIEIRLHGEAEVPDATAIGADFLDAAQGIEQRELAQLAASRLAERARRLRRALARLQNGEYGICSACGAPIPPARLRAVPDTATCVSCQEGLERVGRG
jgi:DnaK suppressor protein